jgi:hypothetical protein
MALPTEFDRLINAINFIRRYAWQRLGEETENNTAEVARWRALMAQLLAARVQVDAMKTNFSDIN